MDSGTGYEARPSNGFELREALDGFERRGCLDGVEAMVLLMDSK